MKNLTPTITQYLEAVGRGEPGADEALMGVVYDSLRLIAANRLGREVAPNPLQVTELVHEAWIRLAGNESASWENRFHFFAAAAEAMRRTLIDNARRKVAGKRGGHEAHRVGLTEHEPSHWPLADELLDLDDALSAFEAIEPMKSQVVKLKFFGGLTIAEIAEMTNLSHATIERYWAFAKAWFFQYMNDARTNR